jgi:hypothetical protein
MVKDIVDLLRTSEFYGVSENVEIAKGKYELPTSWKDAWYKIKRHTKDERKPITWGDIWNKIKTHKWQIRK